MALRSRTSPARTPVVNTIGEAEVLKPFIATQTGNGADSVLMSVSDGIGLRFDTDGKIGSIDLDEDGEEWTFVRYLTDTESVQIVGG